MTVFLIIVATVVALIGVNGLFVAAEFSAVAARRTKISQMAAEGNWLAGALTPILESSVQKDRYLAATQMGITISSLVLGAYGQNVIADRLVVPLAQLIQGMQPWLGLVGVGAGAAETTVVSLAAARSIAVIVTLAGLTILLVVLSELFPKSVAIQYPEEVALAVLLPMRWTMLFLRPFIWFFNGSGVLLLRLLPWVKQANTMVHSPEEIEILVTESHEGGMLDDQARQMLRNTFRLRDLVARQVMIHRTKILAAPENAGVMDLLQLALDAGYSRIPLYRETIDNVVGFVHVKDLFRLHVQGCDDLDSVLREVLYVPETMPVLQIWERLNQRRKYVAIVFDEFGGTAGLISFEDLIEEIFGELQDEFDDEMALIARDKTGRVHLRGDLLVSDVNEYLELSLPEEIADTLGGLIFSELGSPPNEGDEVVFGETVIRVEQMEDLSVQEVSLKLTPTSHVAPFSEWEVTEYDE